VLSRGTIPLLEFSRGCGGRWKPHLSPQKLSKKNLENKNTGGILILKYVIWE
jgi:hypothetical protein